VPPIAGVKLTIVPARGMNWIVRSATTRRLGLGLIVILVVGGIGLLLVPPHVRPRLVNLLVAAVVLSLLVTLMRSRSSAKVRVEVRRTELAVIGIKSPLVVPLREVGSACVVQNFRQGIGFTDPLLMVFNRDGKAIFSLAGRPWATADWDRLLSAIGARQVDRIAEPLTRKQLDHRYPAARSATDIASTRRRKRVALLVAIVWGTIIVLLILH